MSHLLKTGPFLIGIAALLWALDGVIRRSLYSLPPITIVFYEHLIGLLIIAPFALMALRKEKFTRKEWVAIIWISFFSSLIGTLWFTSALVSVMFIPFSVVFLLQKLQPIFAISAGAILLKEKLTPTFAIWAVLAMIAAYFVTFPGGVVNFATGSGTITAALFAVGAAFAWGTSTAVSRYALLNHSQTAVTGLRFFIATIMAGIALYFFYPSSTFVIPSTDQLTRFLFIALSTGMVALWIYYKGLKHTETKVATIVELIFPVTAVLIDVIFFKTILTLPQYLAAAVLMYCVYKISRLNKVK